MLTEVCKCRSSYGALEGCHFIEVQTWAMAMDLLRTALMTLSERNVPQPSHYLLLLRLNLRYSQYPLISRAARTSPTLEAKELERSWSWLRVKKPPTRN